MYIVRWLAGHPILSFYFLGVLALFLIYGPSSDDKSGQEVTPDSHETVTTNSSLDLNESYKIGKKEVEVEAEKSASADTKEIVKSEESTQKLDSLSVNANIDAEVDSKKGEIVTEKESGASNKLEPINVVENTTSTEKKEIIDKAVVAEIQKSGADTASTVNNDTSEVSAPVDVNSNASVTDLVQTNSDELLKMAREAYWNNGLEEAASIYQELITLEPNVVSHQGELGNVFWRLGYPKKAAALYAEIAIPMIENGNAARVGNMVGFIGLFFPEKAAEIKSRLEGH